ncbi:polyphenol oxidase family protein [Nesterenkonia sp. F]|uniref:polyphenol oxidase family protein n=1 Tax=Nesterenkonia sp. F TaxID=795955 RepID=UPI000255CEBA|nr:polyphenol oxidase family protein [Nesterenkonia sp. F]
MTRRPAGDADAGFWWHHAAGAGVRVAFTSSETGNLALHVGDAAEQDDDGPARREVLARRRMLERRMGVAAGRLRFLEQIHSAEVRDADASGPADGAAPVGDAWVSPDGSHPLAIMVADCLPVLLVGARGDGRAVTGAAHAGRPGLLAGVLERTVERMRDHGAQQVRAWIGPGACGRCYEVPESMHADLTARRPALSSRTRVGTPALDLRAEAQTVLVDHGVSVAELSGCTIEDRTLFSHRREPGRGRFVGVVWRPEGEAPGSAADAPR